MKDKLVASVADYYSSRLAEHGATAKGVDWNGEASQYTRFQQLAKILPEQQEKLGDQVVADLGCGYGALHDYIASLGLNDYVYHGYDISNAMCQATRLRLADSDGVKVFNSNEIIQPCDYGIASGIFSVRLQQSNDRWLQHMLNVLSNMNDMCGKGFAFNCLTSYSDADKMQDYLYYSDPMQIFDYCKTHFSKDIALLHDYGLYEFTVLVRK